MFCVSYRPHVAEPCTLSPQMSVHIQGRRKQICIGQAASSAEYSSCAKFARPLGGLGGMPPRKILDFRPSEIVSGAIQPRGPATLLRVSVPSLIPSRADSGWGLSLSWYIFFFFFFFGAEHWSGGRRTCRTCSYGPDIYTAMHRLH